MEREETEVRVYKRRWVILLIFSLYAISSSGQWIQYSIIGNIISEYYNVSRTAVDWTALNWMASYCVFIMPAMYLTAKYGLRHTVVAGSIAVAIGTWLKLLSVAPDRFPLAFVAHFLVGASQVFMLSIPPNVAALWFPPHQISTACALQFIGNQFGVAIGFILSPSMVKNHSDKELIGYDLKRLYQIVVGFSTLVLFLVIFFFKERPPCPPSEAEAKRRSVPSPHFYSTFKRILSSKPFWLILLISGINQGLYNAISTLLNQILLSVFPGEEVFVGRIGLISILTSTLGSFSVGVVLDKTHAFKMVCQLTNLWLALSVGILSFAISRASKILVYVAACALGNGIGLTLISCIEFALELTYPESEGTVTAIILISCCAFGIGMTIVYDWLFQLSGHVMADIATIILLLFGSVLIQLTPTDYRRQRFIEESRKRAMVQEAETKSFITDKTINA